MDGFTTSWTHPRYGTYAVDLYTGETVYWRNTTGSITGRAGGFDAYGESLERQ